MSDTFPLAKKIGIVQPAANLDYRYGPWPSIQRALEVTAGLRELGLTVAISSISTGAVEYHFKNGITDSDLIIKSVDLSRYLPLSGGTLTGNLSTNNLIYAKLGNSDEWNAVYSKVKESSATWESVYTDWNILSSFDSSARTFVGDYSANIQEVITKVGNTSANWDSVYSGWNNISSLDLNVRTFVNSNSSNINNVSTKVNNTSANWDSVYSNWNITSSLELNSRVFVNANSAVIRNVNTVVSSTSANWNSVYSSWNITSSLELNVRSFVNSNSSIIRNVTTLVSSTSANWNSVYSSWNQSSSLELNVRSFVNQNSSTFNNVNTKVISASSNWDSAYSSWNQNSSLDLNARSFVNSNSSDLLNIESVVLSTSANWNSAYSSWNQSSSLELNVRTFVNDNSSNIVNVNSKVIQTSANWDSAYSSWNQSSGLELNVRSFVNSNSSNIINVNSKVISTSANWDSVYSSWNQSSSLELNVRSFVNTNSSNVVNVNSKVIQTSANWDSVYSNWNSVSSLSLNVRSFVNNNSSNIVNVNTWVNNNSGATNTAFNQSSGKYESVFSTVCSNSANWNLAFNYGSVYASNSTKYIDQDFLRSRYIPLSSVDSQLSLTSTNTVQNSTIAIKIKNIEDSLNILVDPPNYVQPTASITSLTNQVEIGTTVNQNITLNWTQNNAGSPFFFRLTRNGTQVGQQATSWTHTVNEIATASTTTFTNTVSYAQGPILNNLLGLPDERGRVASGSKQASTSFTGYYRIFYGVVSVLPSNLRNLPKNNHFVTTGAGTVVNLTPSEFGTVTQNIIAIAMPSNRSLLEVITNANETITNNFQLSTTSINDANNIPVSYKLYTNTTVIPLNIPLLSVKYI